MPTPVRKNLTPHQFAIHSAHRLYCQLNLEFVSCIINLPIILKIQKDFEKNFNKIENANSCSKI